MEVALGLPRYFYSIHENAQDPSSMCSTFPTKPKAKPSKRPWRPWNLKKRGFNCLDTYPSSKLTYIPSKSPFDSWNWNQSSNPKNCQGRTVKKIQRVRRNHWNPHGRQNKAPVSFTTRALVSSSKRPSWLLCSGRWCQASKRLRIAEDGGEII